jgi:hypothetical protein
MHQIGRPGLGGDAQGTGRADQQGKTLQSFAT